MIHKNHQHQRSQPRSQHRCLQLVYRQFEGKRQNHKQRQHIKKMKYRFVQQITGNAFPFYRERKKRLKPDGGQVLHHNTQNEVEPGINKNKGVERSNF